MANTAKYVRERMRVERSPQDAGTTLTIKFTAYDNGVLSINGSPKGDFTDDEATRWLAASRFVQQLIEEFRGQLWKEKKEKKEKKPAA